VNGVLQLVFTERLSEDGIGDKPVDPIVPVGRDEGKRDLSTAQQVRH